MTMESPSEKRPKFVHSWNFDKLKPENVNQRLEEIIEYAKEAFDSVGSLPLDAVTYENTIQVLANVTAKTSTDVYPLIFIRVSSTNPELREASTEAQKKFEGFEVEMSMRKDIFDRICEFEKKFGTESLSPEASRYVKKLIRDGKRCGLHLDEEVRKEIKSIKKKISDLEVNFQRNIVEDKTFLLLSAEELAGLPQDFIDSLEKVDGKSKVTMQYPHYFPVVKKCTVAATRQKVDTAFQSRCMKENVPILEELIQLRHKQAQLLGYPNHATYIQEIRMAKKPETVETFLTELSRKLQPLWAKEREMFLQLKKEQCEASGEVFVSKINIWDMQFLSTLVEEKFYQVDQEALKPYFPLERVTEGLLKIYQSLLGLKFTEVTDSVEVWHPEVTVYQVHDAPSGELLGYFALDLFPREGKYGHAAVFEMQPSCVMEDGKRQVAGAAMMANFTKPTSTKPSLLKHDEVETYFHEFGHVMHYICARADLAEFAGYRTERDFVEAPSQMLENWVWEKEALRLMSGHYLDGSLLPDDMIEKLVAAKNANAGHFNLRQIVLGTFDQRIHTRPSADTATLFAETYKEIMGLETIPDTNRTASWGHLAGHYDAQYYGYMWSEVYSMDMFETKFKSAGIMNPMVGVEYRKLILEPGGTKDGADMLQEFLGRSPSQEPFLRSKGLVV